MVISLSTFTFSKVFFLSLWIAAASIQTTSTNIKQEFLSSCVATFPSRAEYKNKWCVCVWGGRIQKQLARYKTLSFYHCNSCLFVLSSKLLSHPYWTRPLRQQSWPILSQFLFLGSGDTNRPVYMQRRGPIVQQKSMTRCLAKNGTHLDNNLNGFGQTFLVVVSMSWIIRKVLNSKLQQSIYHDIAILGAIT